MRPILYKIIPFSASSGTTIKWSWAGNLPSANRCIIRDNSTNAVIYDATQQTMQNEHTVPPDFGGVNGKIYNITCSVFDQNKAESEFSKAVLFKCLGTPSFSFKNIVPNQVITTSNIDVELTYSQPEGELLDSWQVALYSSGQSEMYATGIHYNAANNDLFCEIPGLIDRTSYYLRATGTTVNGIPLDTGYVRIATNMETSNVFFDVELSNVKDQGHIYATFNIISIEAISANGKAIFIDGDYVDARNDRIIFDKGILVNDDFSLFIRGYGFQLNQPVFAMGNGGYTLELTFRSGIYSDTGGKRRWQLELRTVNTPIPYVLYSNYIDEPAGTDILSLCMERINGWYNIKLKNMTREG